MSQPMSKAIVLSSLKQASSTRAGEVFENMEFSTELIPYNRIRNLLFGHRVVWVIPAKMRLLNLIFLQNCN